MRFFVRTASHRDLEAVRALLVETWHATYDAIHGAERVTAITDEWHSLAALEARLAQPGSEFLVADDGATIGGMAFAAMRAGTRSAVLHQLYVRPDCQGRGIGGMLLDEIEGCFPEADSLGLEVEENNGRAVAFYLAHGFSRTGRIENCDCGQSGIPALTFAKALVPGG